MGNVHRAICHLNIVGYRIAVATAKNRGFTGRQPFVTTRAMGSRSLVLTLSLETLKEGISLGTMLATAERKIKGLTVLPPDLAACETMN
jgi:DNA polymerase-4